MEILLVFKGPWNILKTLGYKFSKVYKDNLIIYVKGKPGSRITIFKRGGVIEFDGYFPNDSGLIFDYLLKNNFVVPHRFNRLAINLETYSIEDFDLNKHDFVHIYGVNFAREDCNAFLKKYKIMTVPNSLIANLKELYELDLIETKVI